MCESTGVLKRPTIGRDVQQGVTQNPFVTVCPSVPCTVQPASQRVVELYAQRNTGVTTSVFFAQDIQAQVNDRFEALNPAGQQTVILVKGFSQEVDRMVCWRMDGEKIPASTKPAAVALRIDAPDSVAQGESFDFTVTAIDLNGNTVTGYTGTVQFFSFTDALADLPSPGTLTNGVGEFSATLNTLGDQSILAQDTVFKSLYGSADIIVGDVSTFIYVTEDEGLSYVAEDGTTLYIQEV